MNYTIQEIQTAVASFKIFFMMKLSVISTNLMFIISNKLTLKRETLGLLTIKWWEMHYFVVVCYFEWKSDLPIIVVLQSIRQLIWTDV